MALADGTRIGHYEITGTLGAGGMGEVYRARDTRLGREVAVKVLPEQVARDPEALARFEREARAVAALSHPNIVAIHDFTVDGGTAYSVTEMLEGETLRQMLDGSPLPVRKALEYGAQVARGLAAAHEKAIVHRDLKPENIFIRHDGQAKILDFGLAKVEQQFQDGNLTATRAVNVGTLPGVVLGTMGYMSPEQVRGQPVDARSDIFAFGAVLYEMLSGKPAFRHGTPADTMSAILKEDPHGLSGNQQEIPPALQRIVAHCLEKNPAERFQSARDLAFQLEAVGTASSSSMAGGPAIESVALRRRIGWIPVFAAGLIAGLAIGALVAQRLGPREIIEPPEIRYLTYSGRDSEPSASQDGRLVAYASVHDGRSQIWIKQLPSGDEASLTKGPDDRQPRISPDGSQVLFTRLEGIRSSLMRIPVVGGDPRKIVDDAHDGDWSPDGSTIAFVRDRAGSDGISFTLCTVDPSGEGTHEVFTLTQVVLSTPRWSPDGKTIATVRAGTENAPNTLLLVPVSGGAVRSLTPPPPAGQLSSPVWVNGGASILYAQSGSTAQTGSDTGASRLTLHEIATGRATTKMWFPNTAAVIDLLQEGSAVLGTEAIRQNLVEVALTDGSTSGSRQWLTRGNSNDRQPVFSPDGRWVLFSSNRGGNLDLWKLETATGAIRRITEDAAGDWDPAFTPDGQSILWSSDRSGHFEIWICAVDGTGARQLSQDGYDAENPTMTRDGGWVVYNSANPEKSGIWKMRRDGTEASRLVPGGWSTPDISPDGKYCAFRSTGEPRSLFIASVENGEMQIPPIEVPGSTHNGRPRWMPDGRSFVYSASDETGARGVYVQEFVPGKDTTAKRKPLLEFTLDLPPESFGISPDGARVIYSAADNLSSLMLAQGLTGVVPAEHGH